MKDFQRLPNLASERLGGRVIAANDDFFAPKENLLKDSSPVFIEGKYTSRGKWMDGWETRRRRTPGYDWCIVRLGLPGIVRGVVVDTSFFRGNFPEECSIETCSIPVEAKLKRELAALHSAATKWHELLPESGLTGDSQNFFAIQNEQRFTHLRMKIYPDGGVARLRVHGEVVPAIHNTAARKKEIDLAGVQNGGRILAASDEFFSEPLNLLMPGPSRMMSDGWETRRRRGEGHDWVIVKLGLRGTIRRVEVSTSHFKGNFPEGCSLETSLAAGTSGPDDASPWQPLLVRTQLRPNALHVFRKELLDHSAASHLRLNIFPDGGVARLRVWGIPSYEPGANGIAWLDTAPEKKAAAALLDCCGSREWVRRMLARRPFGDAEQLLEAADEIWAGLKRKDWLEAFRHHPRIGGKKAARKQSAKAGAWSEKEQAPIADASLDAKAVLAAANRAYEAAFGYIFIVCATGKSTEQILKLLQQRLGNDPATELRAAAEEQRKITHLRLGKLLAS
ncbi:MAG: allantoicase [Candidatus Acidiferrales bacterium]